MQTKLQPDLSLLIPFRSRAHQVHSIFPILASLESRLNGSVEIIAVEVCCRPKEEAFIKDLGCTYINLLQDDVFPKSKALNVALNVARGEYVTPYDVDLVPGSGVIEKLIKFATDNPTLLIAGYRLMSNLPQTGSIQDVVSSEVSVAQENQPSALFKHLTKGERFGVVPAFKREVLQRMNGWDEKFKGWGGEDQEVIERYLGQGHSIVLSPDLVYYHLHHQRDPLWGEEEFVIRNREYYSNL